MKGVNINDELLEIVNKLSWLYAYELQWRQKNIIAFDKSGARSHFYKFKPSYYTDEEWLINRFVTIAWRVIEVELPLLAKAFALSSCEVADREQWLNIAEAMVKTATDVRYRRSDNGI